MMVDVTGKIELSIVTVTIHPSVVIVDFVVIFFRMKQRNGDNQ